MFIPIVVGKGSNMSDYRHAFHGATSASKAASDRDKEVQNGQFKDLLAAAWPMMLLLFFACLERKKEREKERDREREKEREGESGRREWGKKERKRERKKESETGRGEKRRVIEKRKREGKEREGEREREGGKREREREIFLLHNCHCFT